jgi:hypothetical protein
MADPKSVPPPPSPYANFMAAAHNEREFFFSFAQIAPESPGMAQLVSRIITSPGHAKAMLRALEDNIRRYEEKFGAIPETRAETPKSIQ